MSLVKQVVSQPEDELYRILSSLQAKEYLYEQPTFPESEYLFKHALTQDVAYGSVLQEERKTLHEKTAQAMETLYREKLEDYYGELAHHYSRSDNDGKAVEYLHLAGQQAAAQSANDEAIHYLTQGLDCLVEIPETLDTRQRELQIHLTLAPALTAAKGYASQEVKRANDRARELCDQLGDPAQQYTVLRGLQAFYVTSGDFLTGQDVSAQLLQLAEQEPDVPFLSDAHNATGTVLVMLGQLRSASEHLERSLALYDPEDATALRFGFDSGVAMWSMLGWISWLLGYPDQALTRVQEAFTRAQVESNPDNLAFALSYIAIVHQWRREPQAVQKQTDAILPLTAEYGLPLWDGWGGFPRGWISIEQGAGERGIAHLQESWSITEGTGAQFGRTYYLAVLAEGYLQVGKLVDGLTTLSDAFSYVEQTQERFYEAEIYRLKGELLWRQSQDQFLEAETCFWKAIEIAQKQSAKSWELRAATGLARLWQSQGKRGGSTGTAGPCL